MDKFNQLIKEIRDDEYKLPDEMLESFTDQLIGAFRRYDNYRSLKKIITDIYRTGRHHEIKQVTEIWRQIFEDSNSNL